MKSKDLQKAVKTKYENGDGPAKIHRDLGGVVSKRTIKLWIKMINNTQLYRTLTLFRPSTHSSYKSQHLKNKMASRSQ